MKKINSLRQKMKLIIKEINSKQQFSLTILMKLGANKYKENPVNLREFSKIHLLFK